METTKILFKWTNVKPDMLPYKPYSPEFEPVDVYVEVKLPNQYIKSTDNNRITLSPLGMAIATQILANATRKASEGDSDESDYESDK